jgi:hypothetical protein
MLIFRHKKRQTIKACPSLFFYLSLFLIVGDGVGDFHFVRVGNEFFVAVVVHIEGVGELVPFSVS